MVTAHRLLYHSTLGVRVIKKKKRMPKQGESSGSSMHSSPCVAVTEAGSYLRLIDSCITQIKAQGPSRTCNESKEEEGTRLHRVHDALQRKRKRKRKTLSFRGRVLFFVEALFKFEGLTSSSSSDDVPELLDELAVESDPPPPPPCPAPPSCPALPPPRAAVAFPFARSLPPPPALPTPSSLAAFGGGSTGMCTSVTMVVCEFLPPETAAAAEASQPPDARVSAAAFVRALAAVGPRRSSGNALTAEFSGEGESTRPGMRDPLPESARFMTTGVSDACTKRLPGVSGVAVSAGARPPLGVLTAPGKSGGPTKKRVLSPALPSPPPPRASAPV